MGKANLNVNGLLYDTGTLELAYGLYGSKQIASNLKS